MPLPYANRGNSSGVGHMPDTASVFRERFMDEMFSRKKAKNVTCALFCRPN